MGYYSFKDGGIGGIHNYIEITKIKYLWLRTWYWVLEKIFPAIYEKIRKKSWRNGYNSDDYKQHCIKWGIK